MTETEFNDLAAQGYNRIPVVLETFADLDTPYRFISSLPTGPTHICSNRCRVASASGVIPLSACPP